MQTEKYCSFGERIALLMQELNLSQNDLAQELNLTPAAIHKIRTNKAKPSAGTIMTLVKKFNVNADWFLFGEGEIFQTENTIKETFHYEKAPRESSPIPSDELVKQLLNSNNALTKLNAELIKMYSALSENYLAGNKQNKP